MKYSLLAQRKKNETEGGDYWRDADFQEHLRLTDFQTSFQYLIKTFLPPKKILEAGCGLGRWVIPLAKEGYQVTGIEIENEAVELIRQNYASENFKVLQGDIFEMPFTDKSFDLVISLGVLEHFEDKRIQNQAIAEHLRVLKDDGVFFVTVPYLSFLRLLIHLPFIRLVSLVRIFKGKKEYFTEYRYSVGSFKKILKSNNLKIVEIVWDDLLSPYSFGLTVDYPLKRFTKSSDGVQYKLNKTGLFIQKFLWNIYPGLISGGIGYYCKKAKVL